MAAPGYLYKGKLTAQGVADSKIILMTASSGSDKELMKARYYLDFFIAGSELGIEGLEGEWAGACYVGSPNYYMHNLARHGWAEITHDGSKAIVFWDSGLNTKGKTKINIVNQKPANKVNLGINFLSAWWIDSNGIGVRFRQLNQPDWEEVYFGTQEKQIDSTRNWQFDTRLSEGITVEVQSILSNDEGVYYSASVVVTLEEPAFDIGVFRREIACISQGQTSFMVWLTAFGWDNLDNVSTVDSSTGIFVYDASNISNTVGEGWYYGLSGIKAFFVNSSGEIRYFIDCPASNPIARLAYEENFDNPGFYRFNVALSATSSGSVTVTARLDISQNVTSNAQYINITVPAGQTTAREPLFRDLSGNTYSIYDGVVTSGYDLIVTPI